MAARPRALPPHQHLRRHRGRDILRPALRSRRAGPVRLGVRDVVAVGARHRSSFAPALEPRRARSAGCRPSQLLKCDGDLHLGWARGGSRASLTSPQTRAMECASTASTAATRLEREGCCCCCCCCCRLLLLPRLVVCGHYRYGCVCSATRRQKEGAAAPHPPRRRRRSKSAQFYQQQTKIAARRTSKKKASAPLLTTPRRRARALRFEPIGDVAEWLRSGLQSRVHQFDSGRRL